MRLDPRILLIGAFVVAASFAGKKIVSTVRGIRNNNPGNIRLSSTTWAGQIPAERQTDTEFVQFITPEYGIRAMARILRSYAARGIVTLNSIAATWAPPSENDTAAYQRALQQFTGISGNAPLTDAQLPAVIAAIIRQENNGEQPYDGATLTRGISMA